MAGVQVAKAGAFAALGAGGVRVAKAVAFAARCPTGVDVGKALVLSALSAAGGRVAKTVAFAARAEGGEHLAKAVAFAALDAVRIPAFTSVSPLSGPYVSTTPTVVTIEGTGLWGIDLLQVGATDPIPPITATDGELTFWLRTNPAGAESGVSIAAHFPLQGWVTLPFTFDFLDVPGEPSAVVPTFDHLTPTTTTADHQVIAIYGANVSAVTRVEFLRDGQLVGQATVTVVSSGEVHVVSPVGGSDQAWDLRLYYASGFLSLPGAFTTQARLSAAATINLQQTDGTVEQQDVLAGSGSSRVLLARNPRLPLILDDVRPHTRHLVAPVENPMLARQRDFMLTERQGGALFTRKISAVGYDDRFYGNDFDGPPEEPSPGGGTPSAVLPSAPSFIATGFDHYTLDTVAFAKDLSGGPWIRIAERRSLATGHYANGLPNLSTASPGPPYPYAGGWGRYLGKTGWNGRQFLAKGDTQAAVSSAGFAWIGQRLPIPYDVESTSGVVEWSDGGMAWDGSYWYIGGFGHGAASCLASSPDGLAFALVTNPGAGNYVSALCADGAGRLMAANGGMFISADRGLTWTPVSSPTMTARGYVTDIALWRGKWWATTDVGVFSSADDGATWAIAFIDTVFGAGVGFKDLFLSATDRLVAFGQYAAWTDDGVTWHNSPALPAAYWLEGAGALGSELYAIDTADGWAPGEQPLYASADGGSSWVLEDAGIGCLYDPDAGPLSDGAYQEEEVFGFSKDLRTPAERGEA